MRREKQKLPPFTLTGAQKAPIIGEIFTDLKSDVPMNRLIQGDAVGSGKTIIAFLAIFAVMEENGYQTALMAPTGSWPNSTIATLPAYLPTPVTVSNCWSAAPVRHKNERYMLTLPPVRSTL